MSDKGMTDEGRKALQRQRGDLPSRFVGGGTHRKRPGVPIDMEREVFEPYGEELKSPDLRDATVQEQAEHLSSRSGLGVGVGAVREHERRARWQERLENRARKAARRRRNTDDTEANPEAKS